MNKEGCGAAKLCACSLGIAFGVAEGLFMLLLAWAGWRTGFGVSMIQDMGSVLHGFAPTFLGGICGALWGVLDGFVFGLVAGWVYNWCVCRCSPTCHAVMKKRKSRK